MLQHLLQHVDDTERDCWGWWYFSKYPEVPRRVLGSCSTRGVVPLL